MKNFFALLLILAFSCTTSKKGTVDLFTKKKSAVNLESIRGSTTLEINEEALFLLQNGRDTVTVNVPVEDTLIKLFLSRTNLFSNSFHTATQDGKINYTPGTYYNGKIVGDDKSIVSLSITDNNVTGVISSEKFGNLDVVKKSGDYVIASTMSIQDTMKFNCSIATDTTLEKIQARIEAQITDRVRLLAATSNCISIDFEIDYATYVHFNNNTQAAINWLTSIFVGTQTLFKAEGVTVTMKFVLVWTTPDGYSPVADQALNQFVVKRRTDPGFRGNLAQLIQGRTGGSLAGIAYVGVLCVPDYRFSVAQPTFNFNPFPSGSTNPNEWPYSWSTEVITHELGHCLGSPHTQSCTWPGGAIDGCVAQEGSCARGPIPPPGGGTIMSYCHLNGGVGIRFSNGFGPLPKAKILSYTNSGCFVSDCGIQVPTCSDGMRNGDETGVDCGGSCPACPTCSDGIKNGFETGIDCGGNCPACPENPTPGSIVSIGKVSRQSSGIGAAWGPDKANDGIIGAGNFAYTDYEKASQGGPWWEVDLGSKMKLSLVKVYSRVDCPSCTGGMRMMAVIVDGIKVFQMPQNTYLQPNQVLNVPINVTGQVVRLQCYAVGDNTNFIAITECSVYNAGGVIPPPDPKPPLCHFDTFKVIRYKPYTADSVVKVCIPQ